MSETLIKSIYLLQLMLAGNTISSSPMYRNKVLNNLHSAAIHHVSTLLMFDNVHKVFHFIRVFRKFFVFNFQKQIITWMFPGI